MNAFRAIYRVWVAILTAAVVLQIFFAGYGLFDNYRKLNYPPSAVDDLQGYIARNLETARQAFRGGVRFAMGSDAVYTMFGENTRELGWFVKAGMTPEQALRSATANGAELLGIEKSLGAIRPGWQVSVGP